jgi:hypothetical protein
MLVNERFEESILITTTCMDAGVNINDTELKHVVCDVEDIGTLIQCIGRKRIQNNEDHIYLYIKTINNNQLGGKKTQLKLKVKKADFLREHTVKEYIEEFPRSYDYNNIVYDEIVEDENNCTKKINELMYFKCNCDICDIEIMKTWGEFGYCKYLANKFGFRDEETGKFNYRLIEEENSKAKLEKYLNHMVGVKLYKEEQKILKDVFEEHGLKTRTLGINTINGYIKDLELNFIVETGKRDSYRDEDGKVKKEKSHWIIGKINFEKM